MNHSKHYKNVRSWYSHKLWSESRVRNAVSMGWITTAEYEEITGNRY